MWLDILSLQRVHSFGGHEILVRKTSLVHRMQYALFIDGVKHDEADALAGTFALHGVIAEGPRTTRVEAIVKQGFFTGRYYCRVGGATTRMRRRTYDVG